MDRSQQSYPPQTERTEDIELSVLGNGTTVLSPTVTWLPHRRHLPWHPKITPYRLLTFLIPAVLGTIKAVATQQGSVKEPITLEWIAGVVVFLLLFSTGSFEYQPIHHIPWHLTWLFKPDCMDAVWWLRRRFFGGFRPEYDSEENEETALRYVVTSYRLLVSSTVCSIGMLKASLTYAGLSTGATWVEWILVVVVSSILYVIGLYESNNVGMWASFFGTDRAYALRSGLTETGKLLAIAISLTFLSLLSSMNLPHGSTDFELPLFLRDYEKSFWIMFKGLLILAFVMCAVFLFASLRSAREAIGDNMPRSINLFLERLEEFMSGRPHQAYQWLRGQAHRIRHLLALLIYTVILVPYYRYFLGLVYRIAIDDIDTDYIHHILTLVRYCSLLSFILFPLVPLFLIIRRAGRALLGPMRRLLSAGAVKLMIALTGLGNVDAHYGFAELVDALRGSV